MIMKRARKFALALGLCGAACVFLLSGHAFAFTSSRIIDDPVFDNLSMTAAQVDTFLNGFSGSCISTNNGFTAPDPTGYTPSQGYVYGGNVSAGTVIAHAAEAYGLNPKVLLSTLQKEEGLVRGDGPYGCGALAISAAVGYGCPDSGTLHDYSGVNLYTSHGTTVTSVTGTCVNSAQKVGFSQQLIHAAWLLKFGEERSEGNMSWAVIKSTTVDRAGLPWVSNWDNSDDPQSCYSGPMTQGTFQTCPSGPTVAYDGYVTIDGVSTHMDTGATASLYWYTPHFSGNQNFFTIYSNWFGSPIIPNYTWQVVGQYAYTDQTKTTSASTLNMLPGSKVYVGVVVKNTSDYTWTNSGLNPIDLGTDSPLDRSSLFCDIAWLGCNRPARMVESSVAPGANATFEFWMDAPNAPGTYREYFDPVAEGEAWFPANGFNFLMTVSPPIYSWQPVGQYAYTDQTKTTGMGTANLQPGDRVYVGFKVRNTGNVTWHQTGAGAIHVGTLAPTDRGSMFTDIAWLGPNRPAALQEASVAPGQIGTFEFWMDTPNRPGAYAEHFGLVAEGITWLPDQGLNFYMNLPTPVYSWQIMGQYAYTDQTKTTGAPTVGLTAGQRVYVGFTAKNTGNVTWHNTGLNPVNVGMTHPIDRLSAFFDGTWLGQNRPTHMIESSVAPGQIGTFEFWMKAPPQSGVYREYFDLVAEGAAWFPDPGMNFYMSVQ
ncbi:MAG TPA: hypothetical protein VLF91_01970 [Candidatus Saccharimonadales bacterium]|nr:hypothetical protein [Candidatus Saccharimonadales bacterium]